MWQQEFLWFFTLFHHEFRKNGSVLKVEMSILDKQSKGIAIDE